MKFVAITAVLALCAGASASFSNMEMHTTNWAFPLSPGMQGISLPQFNTLGGTRVLKGVQLDVEGDMSAAVTAENDSTIPVNDFSVSLTGIVDVNIATLSATLGIIGNSATSTAAPSDGMPGMGPDFVDFGTISDSDTDTDFSFPLPVFIGNGFLVGSVVGNGGFATSGTSDATIQFSDFGTKGTVKITYFYDVIPTPGAASLIGLAGLAGLRRRR